MLKTTKYILPWLIRFQSLSFTQEPQFVFCKHLVVRQHNRTFTPFLFFSHPEQLEGYSQPKTTLDHEFCPFFQLTCRKVGSEREGKWQKIQRCNNQSALVYILLMLDCVLIELMMVWLCTRMTATYLYIHPA